MSLSFIARVLAATGEDFITALLSRWQPFASRISTSCLSNSRSIITTVAASLVVTVVDESQPCGRPVPRTMAVHVRNFW
jgi:hypothetical protein